MKALNKRATWPLWECLDDKTKVELAQAFNLPVFFVETSWGTEIRLRSIYYGDEMSLEEIDRFMRQKPHPGHPSRVK